MYVKYDNNQLIPYQNSSNCKIFKTHLFVESELKKCVNSIIKIANER